LGNALSEINFPARASYKITKIPLSVT
jgi:hypothetical protein